MTSLLSTQQPPGCWDESAEQGMGLLERVGPWHPSWAQRSGRLTTYSPILLAASLSVCKPPAKHRPYWAVSCWPFSGSCWPFSGSWSSGEWGSEEWHVKEVLSHWVNITELISQYAIFQHLYCSKFSTIQRTLSWEYFPKNSFSVNRILSRIALCHEGNSLPDCIAVLLACKKKVSVPKTKVPWTLSNSL